MARLKEFDPHEKLAKAKELFGKKGYHATSVQDLSVNLKLSRSSMYDTFGDKHQLFIDCLQSEIADTLKNLKAIIPYASSPINAIERMIFGAIKRVSEDKDCLVAKSIFEMATLDDHIKKILKDSTNTIADVFEGLLLKAREQGEFASERNIKETAAFIVACFAGFYQVQVLYENRKMLDQMATGLIRHLR